MLEVQEVGKLEHWPTHHLMIGSEPKNLIAAKALETIKLELWSGFNLAKNPWLCIRSMLQRHQDKAGRVFGWVWNPT